MRGSSTGHVSLALAMLGLNQGASAADIKRAYAALLRQHRPDEDPTGFQRLNEAYRVALRGCEPSTARPSRPAPGTAIHTPSGPDPERARSASARRRQRPGESESDIADSEVPASPASPSAAQQSASGRAGEPRAGSWQSASGHAETGAPEPDPTAVIDTMVEMAERASESTLERWLWAHPDLVDLGFKQACAREFQHRYVNRACPIPPPAFEAARRFFQLDDLAATGTEQAMRFMRRQQENATQWSAAHGRLHGTPEGVLRSTAEEILEHLRSAHPPGQTLLLSMMPGWLGEARCVIDFLLHSNQGVPPQTLDPRKLRLIEALSDTSRIRRPRVARAATLIALATSMAWAVIELYALIDHPLLLGVAVMGLALLRASDRDRAFFAGLLALAVSGPLITVVGLGALSQSNVAALLLSALVTMMAWLAIAWARTERLIEGTKSIWVHLRDPLCVALLMTELYLLPSDTRGAGLLATGGLLLLAPGRLMPVATVAAATLPLVASLAEGSSVRLAAWVGLAVAAIAVSLGDRVLAWRRGRPLREVVGQGSHLYRVAGATFGLCLLAGIIIGFGSS